MTRLGRTARGSGFLVLGALFAFNAIPLYLILRQAFAPPGDASGWPLALLPSRLTAVNLVALQASGELGRSLVLSLCVAAASTVLALGIGLPAGWSLARRWGTAGGSAFLIARVVPSIAIAIPLAGMLIRGGLYNHRWGLGLVLCHLSALVPVVVLISYSAFLDVSPELEEAAWIDGCTTLGAFFRVALPSARPAVGAAAVICFLMSWDELTFALLIQVTHRTLPPLIFYHMSYGDLAAASALAAVTLPVAGLAIVLLLRGLDGASGVGAPLTAGPTASPRAPSGSRPRASPSSAE